VRLLLISLLAFITGVSISVEIYGAKNAKAFYHFYTSPSLAISPAALELLERGNIHVKGLTGTERAKLIAEEFSREIRWMRWTDSGELEWGGSHKTPPPNPQP
jgi:hypothetical protein